MPVDISDEIPCGSGRRYEVDQNQFAVIAQNNQRRRRTPSSDKGRGSTSASRVSVDDVTRDRWLDLWRRFTIALHRGSCAVLGFTKLSAPSR